MTFVSATDKNQMKVLINPNFIVSVMIDRNYPAEVKTYMGDVYFMTPAELAFTQNIKAN